MCQFLATMGVQVEVEEKLACVELKFCHLPASATEDLGHRACPYVLSSLLALLQADACISDIQMRVESPRSRLVAGLVAELVQIW